MFYASVLGYKYICSKCITASYHFERDSCLYDSRDTQILELSVSEFCSTIHNSHVKSRVCFRVLS